MDWSYIAGYFDGEGTAWCREHSENNRSIRCTLSWVNTNLESLEAMREFMGIGSIYARKRQGTYKILYDLHITDHAGLSIAVPELLKHCIIKRDALLKIAERLPNMKPRHSGWGALNRAGEEEIRRLYWDEKLSWTDIGERFGVTPSAVKNFMVRHNIPRRERGQATREGIARRTVRWEERNRKLSERKLSEWQNPEYRERMLPHVRTMRSPRNTG